MNETQSLVSVSVAAERLGVPIEIIRRAIASGHLPVYQHWFDLRYRRVSIDDLAAILENVEPRQRKARNGEGSLRRRPDGRFELRLSMPDGSRKSVYGKTAAECWNKVSPTLPTIDHVSTNVPLRSEDI
jgi:hypothetical protein